MIIGSLKKLSIGFFENSQSLFILVEDGGVEPQPERSIRLANGARATARSSSRQYRQPAVAEGAGVEPGRLRATRFSGPVSAPRRPRLPESARGGNRTRACALKARRPRRWTTRARVPPAGFEPAHRASEARVTSTYGGERSDVEAKLVRESNPVIRFRRPESDPSTEPHSTEHRAGVEPAIRALQARALPLGDRRRGQTHDA